MGWFIYGISSYRLRDRDRYILFALHKENVSVFYFGHKYMYKSITNMFAKTTPARPRSRPPSMTKYMAQHTIKVYIILKYLWTNSVSGVKWVKKSHDESHCERPKKHWSLAKQYVIYQPIALTANLMYLTCTLGMNCILSISHLGVICNQ